MAELTNYQYYGLVGKSVSDISSSITQGYSTSIALNLEAGAYGMSADMLEIQAEQEIINAEAMGNVRMDKFNQSAAANVAMAAAMGKTGENTTIAAANYEAATKDVSLMRREGKMKSLSAKSSASAARSAAKQAEIAADAAKVQGIIGAVSGATMAVGSYSMIGG